METSRGSNNKKDKLASLSYTVHRDLYWFVGKRETIVAILPYAKHPPILDRDDGLTWTRKGLFEKTLYDFSQFKIQSIYYRQRTTCCVIARVIYLS